MNDYDAFILPLNIKPSFDDFLTTLLITKGGLAAQLLEPVYRQFFVNSIDLKDDYNKYYSIEYPTLEDYIEVYHGMRLLNEDLDKKHIFKFTNQCQLTDPMYDHENDRQYLKRLIELLKEMDGSYED